MSYQITSIEKAGKVWKGARFTFMTFAKDADGVYRREHATGNIDPFSLIASMASALQKGQKVIIAKYLDAVYKSDVEMGKRTQEELEAYQNSIQYESHQEEWRTNKRAEYDNMEKFQIDAIEVQNIYKQAMSK